MSAALIAAVNFVAETKMVGRSVPFHRTLEFAVNPLPLTINEKSPLKACLVFGSSEVMATGGTTFNVKFFVETAPQLSVAVTVKVNNPTDEILARFTTPVAAVTEIAPANPAEAETVTVATEPLSIGAAEGVAVVEAFWTISTFV